MTTNRLEALVSAATERVLARSLPSGMGQEDDILAKVSTAGDIEAIKSIREAVSPWLWLVSITGAIMAFMNTRRVSEMYGRWKAAK
jgi:hypothetical protein